ncbi:hypothetical protein [Aliifodinibius salipaludis]|nr:hypothetical protein [Aliifodinibius salipaludis]
MSHANKPWEYQFYLDIEGNIANSETEANQIRTNEPKTLTPAYSG